MDIVDPVRGRCLAGVPLMPHQPATHAEMDDLSDRSDRRLKFVLLMLALAYVFLGVTLWITIDLRSTINHTSRVRREQLNRIERKVDHVNATLAFLDHGRKR